MTAAPDVLLQRMRDALHEVGVDATVEWDGERKVINRPATHQEDGA